MFLKDLSDFSLQSLRVFSYVASMGSVVEAAQALKITQPAVSLQISNLEKHLKFHLFEKQGRKNVLTLRGQEFYQKLLPHLEQLEQIILESKEDGRDFPELNIGAIQGVGEHWLASRFKRFLAQVPGVKLRLELAEDPSLIAHLLTGRISFIITPRQIQNPQVVSKILMDERFVPIGSKKVIEKLKEKLESKPENEALINEFKWVGYGDSLYFDPWAPQWFDNSKIRLERRFRYHHHVNSYSIIKNLLLEDNCLCIAPEHVCEEEIKAGKIHKLETKKFPALTNHLYISYRDGSLNKIHQEFKDFLYSEA